MSEEQKLETITPSEETVAVTTENKEPVNTEPTEEEKAVAILQAKMKQEDENFQREFKQLLQKYNRTVNIVHQVQFPLNQQ